MGRVFRFVFKLFVGALVFFLLTAVGIVLDGLSDAGQKADVALVTGHAEVVQGKSDPRLDRVVQLYNDGEFPAIIVSGSTTSDAMAEYLESRGIPSSAIIEAHPEETAQQTARNVAEIMKEHQFQSVMIVAEYYHMALTQLALMHEGVTGIQKAHVGKPDKADAWKIGLEVVAVYDYVGKIYLLPAAEKAREEAQAGIEKAKVDAANAKEKVNKSLDGLTK
jgi:hypothetical protein